MPDNIAGGINPSGTAKDVLNPSTIEVIGSVPMLTLEQVRERINMAHETYQTYSKLPASKRRGYLRKASELIERDLEKLAQLMSAEIGRPIKSARGEIKRAAFILESCASEIETVTKGSFVPLDVYEYPGGNENRIALTVREPIGVIASITPFNFPAASFAHKVGAALAVGNTVVHKPTISAPLTQIELAKIMFESGFPEGSVSILTGNSAMIGKELTENHKVRLISFTGSSNVGLGQFCNSTKRLIVHSRVADQVTKMLTERIRKLKVGNAKEEATDVGPLINQDAVGKMEDFVKESVSKGGQVLYQGTTPKIGSFFPPTLIRTVTDDTGILRDEVFGPILPIRIFDTDKEAIGIVNSSIYGLNASIYSSNFSRAYRLSRSLEVGTVVINDTTRLRWDNLPFGGPKLSGIGRESVHETMLEMTEPKVISYTLDRK
ncbi:MAG: aldehyde dehydrogenase family protein [Candidatus Thermoplasmatota archaeon]|nr:aldehyde dehydrogenase family protein [Candidatus Thermoplasmatota archaeon]